MHRNYVLLAAVLAALWAVAPSVRAQVRTNAICSNPAGQILAVVPAANAAGQLAITPANFPGYSVWVSPISNPVVAYINLDPTGTGTLILKNGFIATVWHGHAGTPIRP